MEGRSQALAKLAKKEQGKPRAGRLCKLRHSGQKPESVSPSGGVLALRILQRPNSRSKELESKQSISAFSPEEAARQFNTSCWISEVTLS